MSPRRPAAVGLEEPRTTSPCAETGRWWPYVISNPARNGYDDPVHWNSIEPHGNSVIASFRHLDAVYKINKSTGQIVWKLGGTTTPQSLQVMGDPAVLHPRRATRRPRAPRRNPERASTTAPASTDQKPRAVRYRINQDGRHGDPAAVDQRSRHPASLLLRLGPAPPESGLADRLGPAEPQGPRAARSGATRPMASGPSC